MNTIVFLSPCLMLPNNRIYNHRAINKNKTIFNPDGYVIYDQCFDDQDFMDGITYIGHASERQGWVKPRNELLKYFYNSDYDYAFCIDANATVSKTTYNDTLTLFDALRNNKLPEVDTVFSSFGMWPCQERTMCKLQEDYFENIRLLPAKYNKSCNWMHGLILKNYKKYYNKEFYIDPRCNVNEGHPEDVFFARLLRIYTAAYICPTIVINKPDSRSSCDRNNGKGTYNYPPVLFDDIDRYIQEFSEQNGYKHVSPLSVRRELIYPRVDKYKEDVPPFISRAKVPKEDPTTKIVSLF